jgi:hypothetical protein
MKTSHFLKSSMLSYGSDSCSSYGPEILSLILLFTLNIGNTGCKSSVSVSGEATLDSSSASSICSGTTLGGVAGTAVCDFIDNFLQSSACRNVGTTQLTLSQEVRTYAGSFGTPASNLPSNYREIPDANIDDDGLYATGINQYGTRPQVACGGVAILTTANKIADCASKNGANATWDGSVKGTAGQSVWKLVFSSGQAVAGTCNTAAMSTDCYEVWQDQRTGLLWSSLVTRFPITSAMYIPICIAAGNSQNVGSNPVCTLGGGNQYATTPASLCSESAETGGVQALAGGCDVNGHLNLTSAQCMGAGATWYNNTLTPTGGQEDYSTGNYSIAKGYMGAKSNTQVRWRLPTKYDYELADVDGIRFVMPDMGVQGGTNGRASDGTPGATTPEVMATWYSSMGGLVWAMKISGSMDLNASGGTARCVGR